MSLQQRQSLISQSNPIRCTEMGNLEQPVTVCLPNMRSINSRNPNFCFKEYQSGSKIINELPKIIFQSNTKHYIKNNRYPRYKTYQNNTDRFERANPFFENYIRKSLQKRHIYKKIQIQRKSNRNKDIMQVVSLEDFSINRAQSPKILPKHFFIKKSGLSFHRYETNTESNTLNLGLECNQIKKKSRLPLLERKKASFSKRETHLCTKIRRKYGSLRFNTFDFKDQDLSPW